MTRAAAAALVLAALLAAPQHAGAQSKQPWLDAALAPDSRADMALRAMTLDEKLRLVHGHVAFPFRDHPRPDGAVGSAGYVAGVPRLGIPALQETDAGLGIANPGNVRPNDQATPLPSGLALAASFDAALAERAGAMIGAEARAKGFNVLLGPGMNLTREPRNGRNFEYAGEDPLLAGVIAGAEIRGIQSNRVIATVKHYALNAQETSRTVLSANISRAAARESDLLGFEIAIARGRPHAVMCAYNRVNGIYSCENEFLLNEVLKRAWAWPGFVMSDWGAVHSTEQAARAGLDQESGEEMDSQVFFGEPLRKAIEAARVPPDRLDDMVRRILRSMFASGIVDDPPRPGGVIDYPAHAAIAETLAEHGLVLLRNRDGALPLRKDLRRIVVIGSHADKGVLSGGGSSQVIPVGGIAVPGLGPRDFPGPLVYDPSSPLTAIADEAQGARIEYDGGEDIPRAVAAAKGADAVIIFAHQWTAEMEDAPNLSLPDGQDSLIEAVGAATANTVVVLETGGPVLMPWLPVTAAVIEAWYPGARGGEAIARVLFGEVNPSGRLPMTFPADEQQLPRAKIVDARGTGSARADEVNYSDGAATGYKWFDKNGLKPLFPFGYGLSYSAFSYGGLTANVTHKRVTLSVDVKNISARRGAAIPQFYVRRPGDAGFLLRLAGWSKVLLDPGETRHVTLTVDPRLFARFEATAGASQIAAGSYAVEAGSNAGELPLKTEFAFSPLRKRLTCRSPMRDRGARDLCRIRRHRSLFRSGASMRRATLRISRPGRASKEPGRLRRGRHIAKAPRMMHPKSLPRPGRRFWPARDRV
ncbi:MAG: beta-glucosidase [Alphaproteobacteria bacterium]|nr:beta-glucosidase [Alphaproteobacteria bacterium]